MNIRKSLLLALLSLIVSTLANAEESKPPAATYEARRAQEAESYFKRMASKTSKQSNFWPGFSHLWLNDDPKLGNEQLRQDFQAFRQTIAKNARITDEKLLTPAIIGADPVLRNEITGWITAYYLFSDKSTRFPRRLDADNQKFIEESCWSWLHNSRHQIKPNANLTAAELSADKSEDEGAAATAKLDDATPLSADELKVLEARKKISIYDPKFATAIIGTENGMMPRLPATLLAAQILKGLPEYKDRKLPNGETAAEVYEGMKIFIDAKWDAMAKHGLLIEAFTSYNTYTLQPIYNLVDFCEDEGLRRKTAMLLDTIWAEWAVGSINGVRGGAKNRNYGVAPGSRDPWRKMALHFFDMGPWEETFKAPLPHLAATTYRVPEVLKDIAKDHVGRGDYTFVEKRSGKLIDVPEAELPLATIGRMYDPVDTRALAYNYSTPDYVMGCNLIDPTLNTGPKSGDYLILFTQNMMVSLIFASNLDARICPVGLKTVKKGKDGPTTMAYHTVQHENIMIVQKHPKGTGLDIMGVNFSEGMKERLVEKDGWHFLQEGDAYVAVKGFSSKDGKSASASTWAENVLQVEDPAAPIVFILGRKAKHPNLETFQKYILASTTQLDGAKFTLKTQDAHDKPAEISLFLDASAIPLVNNKPINFLPENVFDSPFFQSKHGSGVVTFQKGDRKMILDFNKNTRTQGE